jgi:hypothetical protein
LSVDIQFVQGLSGTPTATLTIALSGSANSLPPVDVTVSLVTNGASIEPIGSFDTPLDNSAGVTGSIPVTGWALDDVEVTRVRIFRDPVGTEPAGTRVFIGDAAFVDGARPDVAGLYPALPRNTRAGWGYLLLTNFLPNLGNGTFKLYAVAEDADGHTTVFGPTTITCTNSSASTPFGANDTPGQGERVSGIVHNFGWVLSPKPGRADVPGGGSVTVLIDGLPVGTPGGWTSRPDLTLLFGGAYDGVGSALAVFTFDSRTLSNGVHTIAWLVNDNLGRPAGVGSRFFTVSNSSLVAAPVTAPTAALQAAARGALEGRRGVVADAPLTTYEADADGVITIEAEELDRIELKTGATAGHLVTPAGPAPLPIGSRIDPEDGTFTWLAGVGFVGRYDFVFDTPAGRRDVTIVLHPKRAATAGAQVVIDLPGPSQTVTRAFSIAGWAADLGAPTGTGIDAIHVWAYPVDGTDPVFLGSAELGVARPDVAAAHGARVASSGYQLRVQDLAPGTYDLAIFPWVASLNGFAPAQVVRVTVR